MKTSADLAPEKKKLVASLLISGFILVTIAIFLSYYWGQGSSDQVVIATAERELGKSYIFKAGFSKRELISDSASVTNLDSIETQETGEIRLNFLNGYVLTIRPNSLITIEAHPESKETLLTIARGNIKIESLGRDPQFFISKDGKKILASEFNKFIASLQEGSIAGTNMEAPEIPLPTGNGEITEDEINTYMNRQKPSFFKCYTQLLQTSPDSKGTVTLNFTIDRSGHIIDSQVQSTELPQADFHKCLTEVLKRVEFRSFSGQNVTAVFPVRFE